MSQELPKHELLLKLLKMTTSSNDAEALVAVRKANQLLATAGWTWDKLLAGKITVVGDPFGNLQRPKAQAPAADQYQPRQPSQAPTPRVKAPSPAYKWRQPQRKQATVNYSDIFGSP